MIHAYFQVKKRQNAQKSGIFSAFQIGEDMLTGNSTKKMSDNWAKLHWESNDSIVLIKLNFGKKNYYERHILWQILKKLAE